MAVLDLTAPGATAHDADILRMRDIRMSFGPVTVLKGVSLSLRRGEILGLLGANGSGKSTLIKVLAGFNSPQPGSVVRLWGEDLPLPLDPNRIRRMGVAFVHQHLALIPSLSVIDNMLISDETRRPFGINWRAERRRIAGLMAEFGLDIDPMAEIGSLSPVERAFVAIVRALAELRRSAAGWAGEGILVLDEPTPFLSLADVEKLFGLLRRIRATGTSVIIVTHDIDEVLNITDRVGAHVSAERLATGTAEVLARLDAAGQVQIARLRMSEFAMGPSGQNGHHPLPQNPVVRGGIPGGSSSGSGVAVGAGLVPTGGAMPLSWTQDCIGPLAASVACARRILGIIALRDLSEPDRPLRIGLMPDGASPRMQQTLTAIARAAETQGHSLHDVAPGIFDDLTEPANVIAMSEAATVHADRLHARPDDYGPQVRARLVQAVAIPAAAYLRARQIRRMAQARVAQIFTGCDLILMPTLADVPPLVADLEFGSGDGLNTIIAGLTRFTRPASFLGLPALSLPVAITSDGPLSVQVIGPRGAEARVARFAETLERIAAVRPATA